MSEADGHTVMTLLWFCAGGMVSGLMILLRLGGRLGRIERAIYQADSRKESPAQTPSVAESSTGGAFETFLAEDSSRRGMPKKEQFAAYRKWRHDNGLNWPAAESDGAEDEGIAKNP